MARSFTAASSEYLEVGGVSVAVPITMCGWFQATGLTTNYALMSIGASGGSTRLQLAARGDLASPIVDPVAATTVNAAGTGNTAFSTVAFTANTWFHVCGVFNSATDRRCFLNGGSKGTDATNTVLGTTNTFNEGTRYNSGTRGNFLDGQAAECAVWNVALDDAEVAELGAGASPLLVRPASLILYVPTIGQLSPEIELRSGLSLTVTGTTQAAHPRIFRPRRRGRGKATSAAATTWGPLLGLGNTRLVQAA